jgi:hypothetical protein
MWTCPECNTNVNDENVFCEVCGATREAPRRPDSTLFSENESLKNTPISGIRNDLACVVVRGFGLYLVVEALLSLPNSVAGVIAANELVSKSSLNVDATSATGTFSSLLMGLLARNALMFVGGLFLLFSDLIVRLLARPTKS